MDEQKRQNAQKIKEGLLRLAEEANNMKMQLEEQADAQVGGLNIKIETSTRAILNLDREILELTARRRNLEERKRTEEEKRDQAKEDLKVMKTQNK